MAVPADPVAFARALGIEPDGWQQDVPADVEPNFEPTRQVLNPDGSPCVGYGCTPEQDAELDADMEEYVGGNLEQACSDGTATVEECFGPGSDLNDNGIADVNE